MKTKHNILNWVIDTIFLAGFLLLFFLDLTGVDIHQWLGLALGGLAVIHLMLHWGWVKQVVSRFFNACSWRSRLYALLDSIILASFMVMLTTGLVISTWFNLPLDHYSNWRDVHVYSSIGTLLVLLVKIGLHWRWIVNTTRRIFQAPAGQTQLPPRAAAAPGLQLQSASTSIGRRQFLTLMGVVGTAASLAIGGVVLDDKNAAQKIASDASESNKTVLAPTQQPTTAVLASSSNTPSQLPTQAVVTQQKTAVPTVSSSSSCFIRCNKRCSFPGRCRRYVDNNNNSKCDLGECA